MPLRFVERRFPRAYKFVTFGMALVVMLSMGSLFHNHRPGKKKNTHFQMMFNELILNVHCHQCPIPQLVLKMGFVSYFGCVARVACLVRARVRPLQIREPTVYR
jgi:hypothetical protein